MPREESNAGTYRVECTCGDEMTVDSLETAEGWLDNHDLVHPARTKTILKVVRRAR